MKKTIFKIMAISVLLFGYSYLNADDAPKRAIKTNGVEVYSKKPALVDEFSQMFSEGEFYGRLRSNNFYFQYDTDDSSHDTQFISGVGVSILYKSALFFGFDIRAGVYTSWGFLDDNDNPVERLKSGKDLLSRYDYITNDHKYMAVLGEANIRYSGFNDSDIVLGRQLVETFYTKSNDTKMIPNTFDGVTATIKGVPNHTYKLAYLYKQKLRDHTQEHSVLMYDDKDVDSSSYWNGNDDSAMHKGLTYSALKHEGKSTNAPLIIAEVHNRSMQNLRVDISSYYVPELLSQVMGEVNYKIDMDSFSITPAIRYIKQFDNGAGDVGGASLSGNATGYGSLNSLSAQMIATRVVTKIYKYKINLGYSNILDDADLVTPWRGFPTAGYTRSMGIYNWKANTKSYRIELVHGANSSGIYKDIFIQTSVLYVDEDEDKAGKDRVYYYMGFVQNIPSLVDLEWRLRLGYAQFLDSDDSEFNYLDSRLELNYLF